MNDEEHWRRWLAELRRWMHRCLAVKDVWNVRLFGDHWLCPYCAKVVMLSGDESLEIEQRVDHLVDACEAFTEVGSPAVFTVDTLKKRALALFVKRSLSTSAAWQMRDPSGAWICPYCAEPSTVSIGGKVDKAVLLAITEVVAVCPAFEERGLEGFRSADEIRESGLKRQMMQQSIAELTEWMTEE